MMVRWPKKSNKRGLCRSIAIRHLCAVALLFSAAGAFAANGSRVQAIASDNKFGLFQTLIVMHGLVKLGYDVQAPLRAAANTLHSSVAKGDAHFMASHQDPLHRDVFKANGGSDRLQESRPIISPLSSGFMIDAAASIRFNLTELTQLKDPQLAARFDRNGNGKADLIGCAKGSTCAAAIDRQLIELGLSNTVEQISGDYDALMPETLKLARQFRPVLYYATDPGWVVSVRPPNDKAVWIAPRMASSTLRIVSNKAFTKKNPTAAAFFNLVRIPAKDVSDQNLKVQLGEDSVADIERHAREWISRNETQLNQWVSEAAAAKN